MALTSLAVEAGEYMKDHAADNSGLFKTCGKARQERIRTCARITAMKALVDKGIAYDSKDGKKIMLACELVCAEKLNKGFDGFKELCQPNAIINAMKSKLGEPVFSKTADKLLENDADYEKLVKQSGSKCLKDFNKKLLT